jgi:hypothetical protein
MSIAAKFRTLGGTIDKSIESPALRKLLETVRHDLNILNDRVTLLEIPENSVWKDVVLQNGWVQYGTPYSNPGFHKEGNHVHLRGVIKSGTTTAGTVLFTLPSDHRPDDSLLFDVVSNNAQARIDIQPDGDLVIQQGNAAYLSLDGIWFDSYR